MADLECAQALVVMKTNTIEELSKQDRLAAVILSVMRDYGLADQTTALKRPVHGDGKDMGNVHKRRKLDKRPAAIEPNPVSALPTPPTTDSDIDEGLEEPLSTQQMYPDVETSPTLPISPISEPAARGRRRSTNLSISSHAGDRPRPKVGQDAGSPARKRYKLGEEGGKTKSRGEQIGACMKAVFNDWETVFDEIKGEHIPKDAATVLAEGIYDDARAVLPPDGPGSLHHDEEIAMAADAGFTKEKGNLVDYYVRKYRTALGFVFLTEHNLRLRAAAEKPNYIEFNKTQAQMFPRGDVNVTSRWFSKWKAWGWFPDMKVNKDLNPELEGLFSKELRKRLINQAIEYEDANRDCKQWKYYPAVARNQLEE